MSGTIIGNVFYFSDSQNLYNGAAIENVPIVLLNVDSKLGISAISDFNGCVIFTDVPSGTYQLIEAFNVLATDSTVTWSENSFITETADELEGDPSVTVLIDSGIIVTSGITDVVSLSKNT